MDLELTGRVAIVAAASKGLGRAVAEELAREGAHVAICARTPSTLAETAAHIQKTTGREVFHQALDVTDSAEVAAFVVAVETRLGRIDVCVTNSGGPPSKSFRETKPEEWRAAVDQFLMSTVFFARETLPRMQKNKWGRLITITSSAVKQPVDGLLLSNSVRAAVTGLARTLANEYAAAVAFLASERASFVNGTSVAVDGGLVRSLL
ncbi:MAG: 3-oxoacyl-ACP reductase [Acidobacteria bacterium]|nr:MAG: 3-oxoacyl-ACP reductase [Acidobacteriota bacterium]